MKRRRLVGLLLGLLLWPIAAAGQEQRSPVVELTYERALALARENAPTVRTARAKGRESDGQVKAASLWRFNPQLSASLGPRFASGSTDVDWSIGAEQWLELGGQRADRVRAAHAAARAWKARSDDTQRRILRDVSLAFVGALYWERRVALAEENLRISREVARVAMRRHEVGDVGGLDRAVSALAVVRAAGDADRARASLALALSRLKALLGLEASSELVCRGDLRQLRVPGASQPSLDDRPDLLALGAEIRQADAEAEVARAGRVPNLALGADYSREEAAHIVQATIAMELPLWDRGQGSAAVAEARRDRLRTELDGARAAASLEVETARAMVQRWNAAVYRFEQEGLETVEEAERFSTASYETGAIPLTELLAVLRELLNAKLDYVDLLFEAATARVALAASRGIL
jgi:cobalt-zinc-cadmium efflux system outer membrane protein